MQALGINAQLRPQLSKGWILSPGRDFWLLQSGCGLALIPMLLFSKYLPSAWTVLFYMWTIGFSLSHQSTTLMRLFLDSYLQTRYRFLYLALPLGLLFGFTCVLSLPQSLSFVASAWLLAQTWHVAAQQYGINRRYLRIAGAAPESLLNRIASTLIIAFPFVGVIHSLHFSDSLFWYKLSLPSVGVLQSISFFAEPCTLVLVLSYLVLELRQLSRGAVVGGRLLCVSATLCVNFLSWYLIRELTWAYVTVSIWHCLQYVVYADNFRTAPPPGVSPLKMQAPLYFICIVALSLGIFSLFQVTAKVLAAFVAVMQFSFATHHYVSDALIWRRRKS